MIAVLTLALGIGASTAHFQRRGVRAVEAAAVPGLGTSDGALVDQPQANLACRASFYR